jgi:hypothetical protein
MAAFWFRWLQVDRRLGQLRRRERPLLAQLDPLEQELNEQAMQKQVIDDALDRLPNEADLRTQRAALLGTLQETGNDHRLAVTDRRIAQYNDGYAQGETDGNVPPRAQMGRSGGSIRQDLRPHEAIRQLLREGLEG